ncbi:MAG: hypothetical protein WC881_12235 [Elusimicrobiota bacterium]
MAVSGLFIFSPHAAAREVYDNINTDTVWRLADSPITVIGNLTVTGGARLSIEPGVVVLFNSGTGLNLSNASLSALGTSADPIYFTSHNDASAGGSGSPAPGDWGSIILDASSATLANVKLRYGGSIYGAMLYLQNNSTLAFVGGEAAHSAANGIFAQGSALSVSSVTFQDGPGWAIYSSDSAVPLLANNTFNGYAIQ